LCELDRQTRTFSGQLYLEQPEVATCNPGRLTPEAAQQMMDRLNFLRSLHLLPSVSLDPELLRRAQAAALMQVANNALSHNPPQSWQCYTEAGAMGSQMGSLAIGPILGLDRQEDLGQLLARQVDIYFAEPGLENYVDVGHRRWNLFPRYAQGAYGLVFDPRAGAVTQASSNWLFSFDDSITNPEYISFPERDGYLYRLEGFSSQPLTAYRWSFSVPTVGGQSDLSQAQIQITDAETGQIAFVRDIRVGDPAFGLETISYSVAGILPNRDYDFVISGIRVAGAPPRTYRFSTALYDCDPVTARSLNDEDPSVAEMLMRQEGLGSPPRL
jgi:hypothetical protein